jgi:hypothetical protein
MKIARRTAAEVIAFHIGWDFAEMSDCRYQSTRWTSPAIYTCGNAYYAAPANPGQVSKLRKGYADLVWQHVGDAYGRPIYATA